MPHTPETWPIGAALLNFTGTTADGRDRTTAGPEAWKQTLREVRLAGFDHVDLTDSWVRPGDLDAYVRRRLLETARSYDLAFCASVNGSCRPTQTMGASRSTAASMVRLV